MSLLNLFVNPVLIASLLSWALAQTLKVPIEYSSTHTWNWALLFRPGGMPSSHSALVTCAAHTIGLFNGFDSSLFALAVVVAMVVIYDATGIRRQAGRHAQLINAMISDLASGYPIEGKKLREVLGHTPLEALAGILLGIITGQRSGGYGHENLSGSSSPKKTGGLR
jgi:acid phosphatase family membrane protein YuiD